MVAKPTMRMTHQREVILEELRSVTTHPSADELYEMVRRRLPHISLGTVYRNLELLAEDGLIHKLELGGTQKRYDGDTSDHYHMRCVNCGRVEDIWIDKISAIEDATKGVTDYTILGHRLEFIGLCPQCGGKEHRSGKISRAKRRKES